MSTLTIPSLMVGDGDDDFKMETSDVNDALERLPIDNDYDYGEDPDLWLYRDRTVAILKRYSRLSIEAGRLPSLLGREFFRGHVSHYRVTTFEDVVIFVRDVEACLEKLDSFSRQLIEKCVLLDYSQDEAAGLLGCWRRTVGRRYPEALDRLSEFFLAGGLLKRVGEPIPAAKKTCQGVKNGEFPASDCRGSEKKVAGDVPFTPSNLVF
jgi:DNA-directed RNA polymerase specialized sigma24 family protein